MHAPSHPNCRCVVPEEDFSGDFRLRYYAARREIRYELLMTRGNSGRVAARAHLSDSRQFALIGACYGWKSPELAALVSLETNTDHLANRAELRRLTRPLQWQQMLRIEASSRWLALAAIALAKVRARCNLTP